MCFSLRNIILHANAPCIICVIVQAAINLIIIAAAWSENGSHIGSWFANSLLKISNQGRTGNETRNNFRENVIQAKELRCSGTNTMELHQN
jgi:hypothetical protein